MTGRDTLRRMPRLPSRGPRRRENTRARLVEASEAVFAEKGLKRVTVDDLVGAAGFTRGAFYSNFSSIDEVFFTLFEQLSEQMLTVMRTCLDAVPEGEFTLSSLADVFEQLKPIGQRWYVIQAEFTLLALRSPEARTVFWEHRQQFEHQMVGVIDDVLTLLGREPLLPLDQMTETAVALYVHALCQDGLGIGTLGTDALVSDVLPHVILGLSRERG